LDEIYDRSLIAISEAMAISDRRAVVVAELSAASERREQGCVKTLRTQAWSGQKELAVT